MNNEIFKQKLATISYIFIEKMKEKSKCYAIMFLLLFVQCGIENPECISQCHFPGLSPEEQQQEVLSLK